MSSGDNFEEKIEDSCHFTYCQPSSDLQQGDILRRTDELIDIIKEYHSYYTKEDYTHFIILTQTCDLVRRKGTCSASYITLAAIRPFELVLKKEFKKYQNYFSKRAGVGNKKHKGRLKNFLESLMNNNHKEYFYLHEEHDYGFNQSACVFLRLSVAIKSDVNYEKCLNSRILSLNEVFRAKLGWLVGNIYSRVGTQDWTDSIEKNEFEKFIDDKLEGLFNWYDDKQLKAAEKHADKQLIETGGENLRNYIESIKPPKRKDIVLDRVIEILNDSAIIQGDKELRTLRMKLSNDSLLSNKLAG